MTMTSGLALVVLSVLVFVILGVSVWIRRRLSVIAARLSAGAAVEESAGAVDEGLVYANAGDVPDVFADKRPSVKESRKHALMDDLKEIGLDYKEGAQYNEPAVHFAAGQKRADRQVSRLNRVRTILLSALDAAERRRDAEVSARAALAGDVTKACNALRIEDEARRRKELSEAPLTHDHLAALSPEGARQASQPPPRVLDEQAAQLIELLRRGPDPDGDFSRARRWAQNISGKAWQECKKCGHYMLDHKVAGGCMYPCAISAEVELDPNGQPMADCKCSEAGEADFNVPSKEPKPPERSKRKRR